MDEPIIYPCCKLSNDYFPKPLSLYQRLYLAVTNDEKDEFMRLIKDPEFDEVRDLFTLDRIFSDDALEIAIEVFNGKTKGLIDMEDKLKDGMTPLHLAAIFRAPRLTKYLIQRGDKVDAVCDYKKMNLEHATPFDIAMESVMFIKESKSLFEMLWRLCYHKRDSMEVIRMLVGSTQNTWARKAFLKYARKGDLLKLAALFLAVPELVLLSPESKLSLFSKLDLELNSLENKTDVKQLSLLLDVFALVGPKLAAYIRLEEFAVKVKSPPTKRFEQSHLELDFFLRGVAHKKSGETPDYYLSFFEADQNSNDADLPEWDDCVSDLEGVNVFNFLSDLLMRRDFDRTDIYRLIPSLESEDAAHLTRAIEKKLSSLSALHGCLECMFPQYAARDIQTPLSLLNAAYDSWQTSAKTSKISKKREKHQPPGFPLFSSRCFEPSIRSFHTSAGSANPMFGVKYTPTKSWENKVMQSTTLKSFFFGKLLHFPLVAKRLLK